MPVSLDKKSCWLVVQVWVVSDISQHQMKVNVMWLCHYQMECNTNNYLLHMHQGVDQWGWHDGGGGGDAIMQSVLLS